MKKHDYLFDTHSLIFWINKEFMSENFIKFLDKQEREQTLYVSSVSFWEAALLSKKKKIEIKDLHTWKNDLLDNTSIKLINPSASEMIDSCLLPEIHKDPFDRLLIAQSNSHSLTLITKDHDIEKYDVKTFWL